MRAPPSASLKRAELVASVGAGLLGAGVALVAPVWLRAHGLALLLAGLALHGAGMTLKYRLESRDGPLLPWERALFWGCWAGLGGILAWVAWRLAVGG